MPVTPLIAYVNVGKSFDAGRVVAVDDVSLEVAEGEFLAIVGGSGSGKTTLLRLANRLIEADRGRIAVEGEDVSRIDPILLRRRIVKSASADDRLRHGARYTRAFELGARSTEDRLRRA